ncbi:putative T7SS-secreted protein [Plantactinospora sp. WMMC1484]|uniref:putative T7SS-secreted protein n=1 Tax=Plantactinospora sp. WMMC1484 TaxID=3404122 RepID=UPI003BF4D02A
MAEFPAHLFRMDGDPAAIRASAGRWHQFAGAATGAAGQITGLDTSQFVGPEGDQFRDGLNADMPRHLRITGDAFDRVSTGLTTFADRLDTLQGQMRPVAQRAPGLWQALQAARGRADRAEAADARHEREMANRPPEETTPDTYRSDSGAAGAALGQAQRDWDACVAEAGNLRGQLTTAVRDCVAVVNDAKGMRFTENPKWWDLGGQFTNFVRDNKELLQQLSGALKVVSLVAGLLSFIPVLTPIMAPIALGTALAASAIDLSIYAATGEGSLQTILIDVGLNLLPGVGKLVKPLGGALRAGGNRLAYEAGRLGSGLRAAARVPVADDIAGITADGALMMRATPAPRFNLQERLTAFREGRAEYVKEIPINSSRHPESAQHILDAQSGQIWRGDRVVQGDPKPSILTIDRAGADANRADSLRGVEPRGRDGLDRDEYPPAMFAEGGEGASVKYIDSSDNTGAGASMGNRLRGLPDGAMIKITVR